MPSNEPQKLAINKLAPLVPINQACHFQEVLDATTVLNSTYTNFLFYSLSPPTIDKLGPWATIWGEDQDLRDILESFQDQSQVNNRSVLRFDIIKDDISCINNQLIEDSINFEENSLTISSVEVSLESLTRTEREFRENLIDPHSSFLKQNL